MQDVNEFLVHAVRLEREASLRFDALADAMDSHGNREVGEFFRRMAHFSRLHMQEAQARCGFRDLPEIEAENLMWYPGEGPETAAYQGFDPLNSLSDALRLALESEKQGLEFYAMFEKSEDPEIRVMAAEFVKEENEHVEELKRWVARYEVEGKI